MKGFFGRLAVLGVATLAPSVSGADVQTKGQTITRVVKMLQEMMEASKVEGDKERVLYAKYKCYCDTSEESKKAEVEELTDEIALLESKIEGLLASSGGLSKQVAKLDADMAENKQAQAEAEKIRGDENAAFVKLEADLKDAISKLNDAVKTLAEVGADQTLNTAQEHKQFMAGYKEGALVTLKSSVKQALLAANAFVSPKQATVLDSFIQAPFTGTYSAQSGEVVGILQNMRDTFSSNLASATKTEEEQLAAHTKLMDELKKTYSEMEFSYNKKQSELGSNDDDLAAKRGQLDSAKATKMEAEDFLSKLLDMCAEKKKQYDHRVAMRADEDAAIAEAISILNSDASFETFAPLEGSVLRADFVQIRQHLHRSSKKSGAAAFALEESVLGFEAAPRRAAAKEFLQTAAKEAASTSARSAFSRLAAMLRANNPFATVLKEIEKMIGLIAEEAEKDKTQKDWCDEERRVTDASIMQKTQQINTLSSAIQELDATIEDPETGLKVMIKNGEDLLQVNYENQVSETKERKEDNVAYQANIKNLVEAAEILQRATIVLRKFYSKVSDEIKSGALLQVKDDPAPPSTWDNTFEGQSEGGVSAVTLLEYLTKSTQDAEKVAHEDEQKAQHAYEDSMQGLKDEETTLQKQLASNRMSLAEKQELLMQKTKDRKDTEAEKKALKEYLVQIKPGCDFITENLELRNTYRGNEKVALEKAVGLIKGTPAYKEAMTSAHEESLGDCKEICSASEEAVECKACLAEVSIPAYCAGHKDTPGC